MALFQPTNITPSDLSGAGTIDATNDLPVTWQVNGTGNTPMTAYKIDIMLNDTASTLLYSTGQVTLAEPFYGNDALGNPQYFTAAVNAAALSAAGVVNSATNSYKLLITQWWNGDESVEQSSASVFIARDNPTVSITNFASTISTISYTFLGSYSQAQGDPIEWARWQISGSANNDVLVDTGRIYGVGELKTSYDGFLDGNNYIIRLSGETINGIEFDTGWQTFVAQYDITILDGAMKACGRKDTDAVQVSFPTPLYTMGNGGGDYEIEDHLYTSVGPDDIITVDDAIEAPMKSLTVEMLPSQDLHGYANPWPGGGGKNKIDFTVRDQGGLTTVKQDGKAVISGTADSTAYPVDLVSTDFPAGTYVWSVSGLKTGMAAQYTKNGSWAGYITQGATFTLTETSTIGGYVNVSSGAETNTTVSIMLESGSTASSFEPYSNYCPIVGHTGASAVRTGKNLWGGEKMANDMVAAVGNSAGCTKGSDSDGNYVTMTASSYVSAKRLLVANFKQNTRYTYIFKAKKNNTNSAMNMQFLYTDGSTDYIRLVPDASVVTQDTIYIGVAKSASGKTLSAIIGLWASGTAYIYYESTGLFEGEQTVDEYVPYTGTTASVTFPALGKNLLNMAVGTHNAWSFVNIPNNLKPNTQYTFSIQGTTSYTYTLYLGNSEQSTRALSSAITAGGSSTFTTPDDMSTEPLLAVAGSTSGAGNEDLANIKPQVELGASKTSYEAYTSTVYGGTYDFAKGKLILTWGSIDLGTLTYARLTNYTNPFFYANRTGFNLSGDLLCERYKRVAPSASSTFGSMDNNSIGINTTGTQIFIRDDLYSDATTYKTAMSGVYLCYNLETPIEYDLTPDELSTFLGTNNIWSDAGDVTAEYAIGQNAVLKLPTNADSAIWDSAGAAPFSIAAPFAVAWRAIMTDVTATLPLISVTMANGILNVTASSDGVTASVSGQQLFTSPTVLANDDDVLLYIQQNQWSLVVNGTVADSGTIPNAWEDDISSIMLYGPQMCLFVWIVENAFTMAQMAKAQENDPAYDNTTHFLAQFNDGFSAGAIRAQEDVTKVTLYRRQAGKMTVQKMVSTDPNSTAVRDYAALNGHSYTYTLIGETAEGNSTSAISSNIASPCIWNYTLMLCAKDANGFYHVQQEYRFSLDVASGTTNNNNNPTLQTNFTRYPLRQPNAQNYRSGTLTSFVGKAVNGKYVDSLSEIDALREISTSSMYKFLKTRKGEIMMVDTASPITLTITDKFEQQPVRAAIPWAEIGDANGKSVITVSGDTYWPND